MSDQEPTYATIAKGSNEYIQINIERLCAVIYDAPGVLQQCATDAANADAEGAFDRLGDWFWRLNECIKTPHLERMQNDEQCPPDCPICAEMPKFVEDAL